MSHIIYKYTINPVIHETELGMPRDAQILSVQVQNNQIQLWALHEHSADKIRRTFRCHCTGHLIVSDPGTYVGTVQLDAGEFVLHVFETTPPKP